MIKFPEHVLFIINKLNSKGHEAFAVGGCIRDSIMGRTPGDWDIATSAEPHEAIGAFKGMTVIPTGIKHGTITILMNKTPYEITTYRIDGKYSDGRRPDSVAFTKSLKEDLARRDFTVNAMACGINTGIVDYFGGQRDLKAGMIRCVGKAEERFSEDYLRMLRAFRFAAVLNFDLDKEILEFVKFNKHKLSNISAERIHAELVKIITDGNFAKTRLFLDCLCETIFPDISKLKGMAQNNPNHKFDVYNHTLSVYSATAKNLSLRLAALFHDSGKAYTKITDENGIYRFPGHSAESAKIVQKALTALKFDNKTIDCVQKLCLNHSVELTQSESLRQEVKKLLNLLGEEDTKLLIKLKIADCLGKSPKFIYNRLPKLLEAERISGFITNAKEPYSIKHLAVNGKDVMSLLGLKEGREVGKILEFLLLRVIARPELNTQSALKDLILNMRFI